MAESFGERLNSIGRDLDNVQDRSAFVKTCPPEFCLEKLQRNLDADSLRLQLGAFLRNVVSECGGPKTVATIMPSRL